MNFTNSCKEKWKEHPGHDVLIIMGNTNAKVGQDNLESDGRQGLGRMNENGEKLAKPCLRCNIV